MWELIQENKRKSFFLFLAMGACLLLLGYAAGDLFIGDFEGDSFSDGGFLGLGFASFVWAGLSLVAYFSGDQILLASSRAKEVSRDVHPQLFNIVEEMKIAAGLPAMPKIYIIDDPAPNAFATGRKSERSAVAVTAGLLGRLNRDELQGVIAHEMSHIMNRDVLFMTFAGVMLGAIVLISDLFWRRSYHRSGSSRRYRSGRSQGSAQGILLLLALFFVILAPIAARLLYFALSRRREYLADASGARLTRYPEGLASALEKIASAGLKPASANRVTAPMYIANPFQEEGLGFVHMFSTHPPVEQRIKILRTMAGGAGYLNYEKAYSAVTGEAHLIPPSGLKEAREVLVREARPEEPKELGAKEQARAIGDLTRAVNQFTFLTCVCGLKIKVPPDFKQPKIICPRCWHSLEWLGPKSSPALLNTR